MSDYQAQLEREAFGHDTNILRRGAPPGNGMAVIAELVEKFPPFPDYFVNDVLGRSMK